MYRKLRRVRIVLLLLAPLALVCAPSGSGGGGCAGCQDESKPSADAQLARQQLTDLDSGLENFSDETVNALATEQGVEAGSSVAGAGDATALSGAWTGTLTNAESGTEKTTALQFGESGELTELALFSEDLVQTTLSFQHAPRSGRTVTTARALAALVFTDDGVNFRLTVVALVDSATDAGRRRTLETITINFALVPGERRFAGLSQWTSEILGTELPDEQVGQRQVEEGAAQAEFTDAGGASARCTSPGGQDDGIDLSGFGSTRVLRSTIGHGRHVVLIDGEEIIFEFDGPVPFCAVVPVNFVLQDLATGTVLPFAADELVRQDLVDGAGKVVASRVRVRLPAEVTAGADYELTLAGGALGLDGEFQIAGPLNGTLPSGDGSPGGDFAQLFRTVGAKAYLTDTNAAAGLALDDTDGLYIAGETGLYGPFRAPGAVTEGFRLAPSLPSLASRMVAVDHNGFVIVKGVTNGRLIKVDPVAGTGSDIAALDVQSHPYSLVVAPDGFASALPIDVVPGDLLISDDAGISVPDLVAGDGKKGGVNLVDRTLRDSNSAYVKLFVAPNRGTGPGEVLAAFRREDNQALEIFRIQPDGVEDRSILTARAFLAEVDGTAAIQLDTGAGDPTFLIIGQLDPDLHDDAQILPADFDGRCVMTYDAGRDRLEMLLPLPIDPFSFNLGPWSDLAQTSDYGTIYVSLPTEREVWELTGLAD